MKILELKKGCFIKPYINKQLEVIREGKRIIIYDGHAKKGDIIQLEDDLAKNILNTIFGNEVIAVEITEEEFKEIILNLKEEVSHNHSYNIPALEDSEDEKIIENTNTEETNNEDEVTTDNTNTEETNNEDEVTTDNTNTEETNNEDEVTTDNTNTEETNNEDEVTTDNTNTEETNNEDEVTTDNTNTEETNNEDEVTTDNTNTEETNNEDEEPKTNTGRRKRN